MQTLHTLRLLALTVLGALGGVSYGCTDPSGIDGRPDAALVSDAAAAAPDDAAMSVEASFPRSDAAVLDAWAPDGPHAYAIRVAADRSITGVTSPFAGSETRTRWTSTVQEGATVLGGAGHDDSSALLLVANGTALEALGPDGRRVLAAGLRGPRSSSRTSAVVDGTGEVIAVTELAGDGALVAIERLNGEELWLLSFPSPRLFARNTAVTAVSPRGALLVVETDVSGVGSMRVLEMAGVGEEEIVLTTPHEHFVDDRGVIYSQDGRDIVIVESVPDTMEVTVHILDAETRTEIDAVAIAVPANEFSLLAADRSDLYYFEDAARRGLRHRSLVTDRDEAVATLEATREGDVGPTGVQP